MATFESLYNLVLPYLPGAETPIVDLHIRRALRDFFKRTTVWRERFEFDTTPAISSYQLQPSTGTVAAVMNVHVRGNYVHPVPEDKRDPFRDAAEPNGWFTLLPQVINMYPTPNVVVPVSVEAAITLPVEDTLRIFPDEILEEHGEAVAAGVISGMMMMPGKPWTQRDAAGTYSRIFGSAIRDTRGKLRDGGQPNQSTFTPLYRFGA